MPIDGLRYIASYPDLIVAFGANAQAGIDHYNLYGQAEGRSPLLFDPLHYGASNPDIALAFGVDEQALSRHYIVYGFQEGRSTNSFDGYRYAASNPDVAALSHGDLDAIYSHYIRIGLGEGRPLNTFDAFHYAASNPDVALAIGLDEQALIRHYVVYGVGENRSTTSFDGLLYAASNPDVAAAYHADLHSLYAHYIRFGVSDGRPVNSFDAFQYAALYPDLMSAFGADRDALTRHYVTHGVDEGRATTGFDATAYFLSNPDLGQAGFTPATALSHWVRFGFAEGRQGDALFGREQNSHGLVAGHVAADFGSPADRDWFILGAAAGVQLSVSFAATSGGAAGSLLLYDSSGHLVASSSGGPGGSASLSYLPTQTGTYYIVAAGSHTGGYDLTASPGSLAPVFTSGSTASVAENSPTNVVVYDADAFDADGGTVSFALSGANANQFSIDASTGQIRLLAAANFEAQAAYSIIVRATDSAGEVTDKNVTISVTNVLEAPVFTSGATASIAENSPVSTLVYDAEATDPDGGTVSFSLSGADAARFSIGASNGEVRLIASADYETQSAYNIIVRATDSGGQITDRAVAVTVTNVLEAPVFTSGTTASIAENSPVSTVIYDANATDPDGGTVSFSLSGADAARFTIGPATGEVRLIASADYETQSAYNIIVRATDSGGQITDRAVAIAVTDLAEVTPVINETQASNDTQATAQSIDPNALVIATNPNLVNDDYPSISIHGSISLPNDPPPPQDTSTDVDFYSITLQAGQQLILDVDGTNGLDAFLTIYGPNGALLITNDDPDSYDPGSVDTGYGHNVDSQILFRAPTSGTYYFSIKSFVDADTNLPDSKGSYTLHVSVNTIPATPQQLLAEDVDALISGASWNHAGPAFNLTYGFPALASYYPQNFAEVASQVQGGEPPVFEAFSATQQAATRALLQLVSHVTQITFSENLAQGNYNVAGTAANANLRYAESSEALPTAYAYYPTNGGPADRGGSAWFGHETMGASDFDTPQRGNYAWMGILHETGHALGLKHGHETPLAITADRDSIEYSVMTYRGYPGQPVSGPGSGYGNEQWGFAQTLMMLDIAALQKIYGSANYNYNSGASVYTWSATTGEMFINGAGQGAPGDGNGITTPGENRIFMTVWDGGGNDTYDLSNYTVALGINLRPGEWSTFDPSQRANLGNGHFARGEVANALMFEGHTDSLIENAIGGSGNDALTANQVANHLTGNGGADLFRWVSTGDAGIGALADTIMDFERGFGKDTVDFRDLDANPATAAHDAFTFIGTSNFHNVAGEVRYDVIGGSAHVFADADGNGTADMEIIVNNIITLTASDFQFL